MSPGVRRIRESSRSEPASSACSTAAAPEGVSEYLSSRIRERRRARPGGRHPERAMMACRPREPMTFGAAGWTLAPGMPRGRSRRAQRTAGAQQRLYQRPTGFADPASRAPPGPAEPGRTVTHRRRRAQRGHGRCPGRRGVGDRGPSTARERRASVVARPNGESVPRHNARPRLLAPLERVQRKEPADA